MRRVRLTESDVRRIVNDSFKKLFESMDSDNLMDRCGDSIVELCEELKNSALGGDSHKVMFLAKKIAECADEINDYTNRFYGA